ncbi:MAG: glycosyltransferase family 2 protein [Magnetococcales bacterium]|nr:glycosyltransferase family 2 protein [Magnetococcales bacterium]
MANTTEPGIAFLQQPIQAVSVIIPCKNEEKAILMTIHGIQDALSTTALNYEIIVVDDGSTDATRQYALEAGARVLVHEINLGYGNAIMNGIKMAKYPVVAMLDADGTYDPTALPEMIETLARHDMVVGQRKWTPDNTTMTGRILRKLLYYIILVLSGSSVPDFNSGFRVFHKYNILHYRSLLCPTFSFTTTLTVLFLQTSHSVCFIPVEYSKRIGTSKVHYLRDAVRTFSFIFALSSVLRPYRISQLLLLLAISGNLLIVLFSFLLPLGTAMQIGLHVICSVPLLLIAVAMDIFVNSQVYFSHVRRRGNANL